MGEVTKLRSAVAEWRAWNTWYVEAFLASDLPYEAEAAYDWVGAFERDLTPEQAGQDATRRQRQKEPTHD